MPCSENNMGHGGNWSQGIVSFEDPMPFGYFIESVQLVAWGLFHCTSSPSPTMAQFLLNDQVIDRTRLPKQPEICQCPNCAVNYTLKRSPSKYYGWPGYIYGGRNTLRVDVLSPQHYICLSKVVIQLSSTNILPELNDIHPSLGPLSGSTMITIHSNGSVSDNFEYRCIFGPIMSWASRLNVTSYRCKTPDLSDLTNPLLSTYRDDIKLDIDKLLIALPFGFIPDRLVQWYDPIRLLKGHPPTQSFQFIFYKMPILTTIDPKSGSIDGGTTVYVRGRHFLSKSYADKVEISCLFGNSKSVHASLINQTHIKCVSPAYHSQEKQLNDGDSHQMVYVQVSLNGQQYIRPTNNSVQAKFMFTYYTHLSDIKSNNPFDRIYVQMILAIAAIIVIAIIITVIYLSKCRRRDNNPYQKINPGIDRENAVHWNDLKIIERISRGSFGDVYRAKWLQTEVALKVIPTPRLTGILIEKLVKEAALMKGLRHPNVLLFLGTCINPPDVCIITEYMPLGSLHDLLHRPDVEITWKRNLSIALQVSRGMNYLHRREPPIIHRDLKSHNLLVDENWAIKICDFGLSRICEERISRTMTACGTPCWTAPEILRRQRYTSKADIYKFRHCLMGDVCPKRTIQGYDSLSSHCVGCLTKAEAEIAEVSDGLATKAS